jgi:TM2 domain-containing membrane protein YozV
MGAIKSRITDSILLGLFIGIIGPIFGFLIYYLIEWNEKQLVSFVKMFTLVKEIQAPILSLSLIFNALLFFGFMKLNLEKVSKGILIGTFLYVPLMIYLKYFNT